MCDPRLMCRQHLLGEHRELHALVGIVARGTSLAGYAAKGLIETAAMQTRHDDLVDEMLERGYTHNSPLDYEDRLQIGLVNYDAALADLLQRCPDCRSRYEELANGQ